MINVKVFGQQWHRQYARERRSDYGSNSNFFIQKNTFITLFWNTNQSVC